VWWLVGKGEFWLCFLLCAVQLAHIGLLKMFGQVLDSCGREQCEHMGFFSGQDLAI
jgi:hypothetical protein